MKALDNLTGAIAGALGLHAEVAVTISLSSAEPADLSKSTLRCTVRLGERETSMQLRQFTLDAMRAKGGSRKRRSGSSRRPKQPPPAAAPEAATVETS